MLMKFFNKRILWPRSRSVLPHHALSADTSFSCSPEGASSSPSCWFCHASPCSWTPAPPPRESIVSFPKPRVLYLGHTHDMGTSSFLPGLANFVHPPGRHPSGKSPAVLDWDGSPFSDASHLHRDPLSHLMVPPGTCMLPAVFLPTSSGGLEVQTAA